MSALLDQTDNRLTATRHADRTDNFTLTFQHLFIALLALAVFRIVALHISVDLFVDEAQYWAWSRELAFGYFSKPPLLAWIIAATDRVCGSGEACVRMASPLLHFATALVVYAIARTLYGPRAAAWSALAYSLGTGLIFSARIVSTDVPLVFFWSLAMLAFVKLLCGPDWRWAVTLGVACGLGMLAKYAMAYFFLGALCAACLDREARAMLMRPQTWAALAIGGLIVLPNIIWNAANDFATLRHTGGNVTGDGLQFRPVGALEFIGAQFAVAGPLVFATLLYLLVRLRGPQLEREDRLMLAFAIPPLALVTALSFWRGTNANWAAPAVVSMTVLAAAWWQRHGWNHWLRATVGLGLCLQVALTASDALAYRAAVPMLQSNPYKRTLGWHELAERAALFARAGGAHVVAAEGRSEAAALTYYLRNEPLRVASWRAAGEPDNYFHATRPLDPATAGPVLLITGCSATARLERLYERVTPLGGFGVSTGRHSDRRYAAFLLERPRGSSEPPARCAIPLRPA